MKSVSTPEGFEAAERAVEIGCIKSSIQTKKVLHLVFIQNIWCKAYRKTIREHFVGELVNKSYVF